jgi:hypothetical protein
MVLLVNLSKSQHCLFAHRLEVQNLNSSQILIGMFLYHQ